jgi:hypothetical protein
MTVFTYALKAPESRRQYPRRLKIFLDYLGLEGNIEEQAEQFYLRAVSNHAWAEESLWPSLHTKKRGQKMENETEYDIFSSRYNSLRGTKKVPIVMTYHYHVGR